VKLPPDHPLYDEVVSRHDRAAALGLSAYLDPITGYTVLTASYLCDRGYCCNAGCRHCPYEADS
jgi:hypothetical protein